MRPEEVKAKPPGIRAFYYACARVFLEGGPKVWKKQR